MKHTFTLARQALAKICAGQHAQASLNEILEKTQVLKRGAITELVYGVLRYDILLQACAKEVLPAPAKLPAGMRFLIQLALYALLFQSDSPAHAIINETVNLIKKEFGQKLGNVGNGALRNVLRNRETVLASVSEDSASRFSLPGGLYQKWLDAYGKQAAENLAGRSLQRPYMCFRVNPLQAESDLLSYLLNLPGASAVGSIGVAFAPGHVPDSIRGLPVTEYIQAGKLSRQAAGSIKILEELELFSTWRDAEVWDACAGVGGKSCALLEGGVRVTVASDINLQRLRILAADSARLDLTTPALLAASAARPPLCRWSGNILADVPCSGTGVLARRPDIKLRWSGTRQAELVRLQRSILLSLAALLKPGAELCYITCAMNREENEDQIEWLLKTRPEFELIREWRTPFDHPWLEGMYGARLKKA
ncbi:MAG: antitermination protein NusB [Desulfovibrio sp.]|nr:antitermination protein NusB [Desulfovibrio sp.]